MLDPDEGAPPIDLVWGDLAEIWTACALHPTVPNQSLRSRIRAAFVTQFGEPLTLEDLMTLFDREPNFEETFKEGDRFALVGLQYVGSIRTAKGPAEKTLVTVITRESYPNRATYSMLGVGIAAMAQRAQSSDFPVVVEYRYVPTAGGNRVKRFEPVMNEQGEPLSPTPWKDGDDGVPVEIVTPLGGQANAPGDTANPGF